MVPSNSNHTMIFMAFVSIQQAGLLISGRFLLLLKIYSCHFLSATVTTDLVIVVQGRNSGKVRMVVHR